MQELSGGDRTLWGDEASEVMALLCILTVMVVTQLCHNSQSSTPKRVTFTACKLHFNAHTSNDIIASFESLVFFLKEQITYKICTFFTLNSKFCFPVIGNMLKEEKGFVEKQIAEKKNL